MGLKIDDGSGGKGRGPAVKNDKNESLRSVCEVRGSWPGRECGRGGSTGVQRRPLTVGRLGG